MIFLETKWPKPTAQIPSITINIECKTNSLYKPAFINLNNWKDHPLKVVKDPQNPKPKINLFLLERVDELIKPNKKHPMIFTIKILSICHRNIAAGIANIEIRKKLLFLKKLFIYWRANKIPNTKANIPKIRELINNLNALANFKAISSSYKS